MNLAKGVISRPWTNSDHMPFMLAGIPVLSLQATLDPEMLSSYHNAADTFDKVNIKYLSEASAVVSSLVFFVANSSDFEFQHKTAEETVKMLEKFGLDQKLKKQKEWPFSSN
jgi:Zn-dependent M28 family amino/carboxypeptidase